jgi:hypothetical protein
MFLERLSVTKTTLISAMHRREAAPQMVGEAHGRMLRVMVRCAFRKREGMKSIRECIHNYELDVETLLVDTRPRD